MDLQVGPTPAEPKRHNDLFRLIVESAREYAIFTTDLAGHVVTWNAGAERIFGYQEAEIIGQRISVIFTPEDNAGDRSAREMESALETGRANNMCWHMRKDGSRFWADGLMMPLTDDTGATCGYV